MNSEIFFRHIGFKVIMTYFAWRTANAAEWTTVYTRDIYKMVKEQHQNKDAYMRR